MADDAPSELLSRRHQMFPVLTEAELARMHRFGTQQAHPRGTRLITAGEPSPGLFVVLKGAVAVSQRDGMGRVTPIVQHGRGHFMGEVGSLSSKPALVDGIAQESVEVLLLLLPGQLRALIIAEADLGERLVRALIHARFGLLPAHATVGAWTTIVARTMPSASRTGTATAIRPTTNSPGRLRSRTRRWHRIRRAALTGARSMQH